MKTTQNLPKSCELFVAKRNGDLEYETVDGFAKKVAETVRRVCGSEWATSESLTDAVLARLASRYHEGYCQIEKAVRFLQFNANPSKYSVGFENVLGSEFIYAYKK